MTADRAATLLEPAHAAPGPPPTRGRLLLLSWNFPPALTAGSLRWQQMARIAAEQGWAIDVVTVDPSAHAQRDPQQLEQLAPGTRTYTVAARTLLMERVEHGVWRATRRLRRRRSEGTVAGPGTPAAAGARPGSFASRDIRWIPREPRDLLRAYYAWQFTAKEKAWARAAARLAIRLARANEYAAVITSGPPHMTHEGGRRVSRVTGLPHIVDMRDPWSLAERLLEPFASPVWLWLAARAERNVVENATLVVANTEAARVGLAARHPAHAERFITVMNGYDGAAPARVVTPRFTAVYAGTIYIDRDPSPLFRAAARVVRELGLTPEDFALEFVGHVEAFDGVSLEALAASAGVAPYVARHPPMPRAALAERLASAAMLVSLPQDSAMAIPSKVFEYMQYSAWVLALAERGSATELVLRETSADVVSPEDETGLARVLRQRVLEHRAGVVPPPTAVPSCSRRAQTGLLLAALDRVIARRGRR